MCALAGRDVPADELASEDVRGVLPRCAGRAPPAGKPTLVRQEGDVAGALGRVAGPVMARVVAVRPVLAGAPRRVGRCSQDRRWEWTGEMHTDPRIRRGPPIVLRPSMRPCKVEVTPCASPAIRHAASKRHHRRVRSSLEAIRGQVHPGFRGRDRRRALRRREVRRRDRVSARRRIRSRTNVSPCSSLSPRSFRDGGPNGRARSPVRRRRPARPFASRPAGPSTGHPLRPVRRRR